MQLTFDADVEAFRHEFIAFLDEHLPDEAETTERSRSTADIPEWARRGSACMFDHGWLLPGNPPEFGGRNATILQQFVHREELSKRQDLPELQPAGRSASSPRRCCRSAPRSRSSAGRCRSCGPRSPRRWA